MEIDITKSILVCRFRDVSPWLFPRTRARIAMWIFKGIGGTVTWEMETKVESIEFDCPGSEE